MSESIERLRIGYIGGQSRRINERTIDGQWTRYLGEYAETVAIPALAVMKLFGGSLERWVERFAEGPNGLNGLDGLDEQDGSDGLHGLDKRDGPDELDRLGERLDGLRRKYGIDWLYVNWPPATPYLLLARNRARLPLRFLMVAHSVGSEYWLKLWLGVAPVLRDRDLLLTATESCRRALLNLSPAYRLAFPLPLCIATEAEQSADIPAAEPIRAPRMLAIGRIEDVKNVHLLLECFAEIVRLVPDARLTVAGEYTGSLPGQAERYRSLIGALVDAYGLASHVTWPGPVEGERKEALFRDASLLINLSTDPGETFGFNLLEAKRWGLPVVCSDWDGFRELVRHGVDGYRIPCVWPDGMPQLDRREIVGRCAELLTNGPVRRLMSENSRNSVANYDYRRIMPQLIAAMTRGESGLGQPGLDEADAAREMTDTGEEDSAVLFQSPLRELHRWFHLERLTRMPFLDEPLVRIAASPPSRSYVDWMPLVGPVISHFAKEDAHAEL